VELESVVKLDVGGLSQAATESKRFAENLKEAARAGRAGFGVGGNRIGTGTIRIDRADIHIRTAVINVANGKVNGLGSVPARDARPVKEKTEKDDRLTGLLATAAASNAFIWKATALANPGAMERFNDAVADTTAVIGHELTPALRELTKIIRDVGDWMANHPTATKAIAYGAVGVAAVSTIALAATLAKRVFDGIALIAEGLSGAARYAKTNFQWASYAAGQMGTAGGAATNAAASSRVFQTGFSQAGQARITGGSGMQAIGNGTRVISSAEMAGGTARINVPSSAGNVPGGTSMLGRFAAGVIRWSGPAALVTGSAELSSARDSKEAIDILSGIAGANPWLSKAVTGKHVGGWGDSVHANVGGKETMDSMFREFNRYVLMGPLSRLAENNGIQLNPFKWGQKTLEQEKLEEAKRSSFGAAARPTQYTDILSSVMGMRQDISSKMGLDPAERTASATERSAESLKVLENKATGNAPANGDTPRSGR